MEQNNINVVYAADIPVMSVSIVSLLKNNRDMSNINVTILATNVSELNKQKVGIHFLVWIEIPCQIFLYKKEDICCPLVIQSIHHKNHERRLNKCPIMILS